MDKRIAIFNSFPFHYEMFGFILQFAKRNNYQVDIYTNMNNDFGFLAFYCELFNNFKLIHVNEYSPKYFLTFITTDDDPQFKREWIRDGTIIISINHCNKIRIPGYSKYINIANFKNSNLDYSLACFEYSSASNKVKNYSVAIIGGGSNLNVAAINKLVSLNNSRITLNIIGRKTDNEHLIQQIDSRFIINRKVNLSTSEMFDLLNESSYLLVTYDTCQQMANVEKSSGSLPLAYTCLCKPIVLRSSNKQLLLDYSIEFDYSDESIILDDVDFGILEQQRNNYLIKFEKIVNSIPIEKKKIPKQIFQTWMTSELSPELKKIRDSWIIKNPGYSYKLYNDLEADNFILEHFGDTVHKCYRKIIPGAFKADLWRYCVLYVYGGIYADLDTICMNNLDSFIREYSFVCPIDLNTNPYEGNHNLFNSFIGIVPNSEIMLNCIKFIVNNIMNNKIPQSRLDFAGPGVIGRAVNKYLLLPETESFIGKEGKYGNIHFLKFTEGTEYVSDLSGNILFQNKNGNNSLKKIYSTECINSGNISWLSNNILIN